MRKECFLNLLVYLTLNRIMCLHFWTHSWKHQTRYIVRFDCTFVFEISAVMIELINRQSVNICQRYQDLQLETLSYSYSSRTCGIQLQCNFHFNVAKDRLCQCFISICKTTTNVVKITIPLF